MDQLLKFATDLKEPLPSKPIISKTYKKRQAPILDTFGPFPDEIICSGIDRVLFYMGAQRFVKYFACDTLRECESDCTINIEKAPCPKSHSSCRSYSTTVGASKCCCTPSEPARLNVTRKCCCSKCCSCSTRTTFLPKDIPTIAPPQKPQKTVNFCKNTQSCVCEKCSKKATQALKRSFSLCSLACRKFKDAIFPPSKNECGGGSPPKWLWTRVRKNPDGSEMYEIFHKSNSDSCQVPKASTIPEIIFIAMPNGKIMPFQTLTCH